MMMNNIPSIPLVQWIDDLVQWLRINAQWFFQPIDRFLEFLVDGISDVLLIIPPIVFIIILFGITMFLTKKEDYQSSLY